MAFDQVNLYDGKAETRKHIGDSTTDGQGLFPALPIGTINGLILIDASGGTYTDPINGARIQLDPSVHLKALHWLGIFEDRSESMYVTPVHALVEARFRYKMTVLRDTTRAVNDAYLHLNAHFGDLDWEKVIPADLQLAALSPTNEVRAAFVLGGLNMLAEDIRTASNSTPQVVNISTLVEAAERDLSDQWLDGNDSNASAFGSGVQVGDCPPADATCTVPPAGCQLGACRPLCDIYANTYRSIIADSLSRFIGPRASPSMWNRTALGSEDARAFTDSITRNADTDLFNDACVEPEHRAPPTIVWEMAPPDGALQGGEITLRVRAIDSDSNKLPTVSFPTYQDTDGDPTNDVATVTIDTRSATRGIDGPLTITAIATDLAGNMTASTRTFQIDNTPPAMALDSRGLYVDGANVWWAATSGPTLHGTVTDAHPGMVQVMISGSVVASASMDGTQWTAQLPATAFSSSGNDITVVATDQAGNTTTQIRTLRLDTTPPSLSVDPSPVFDEIMSTFQFTDDTSGSFAVHIPQGLAIDLARTDTCPTVHKYAHLLFAPSSDGMHSVLGSKGALNPLQVNATVTDDGTGIQPGSVQYRVLLNTGTTTEELLPWTAMSPSGTHYVASLYRNAIPQLGTTNGEYHIQLRATDRFGRTTIQERCWNHVILAPPLRPTSGGGEPAAGFQRALFSTKLDPGPGETGDFAEKLLNGNPIGAAIWRTRFKNYLGLPIYVAVGISRNVSASIFREFRIMKSLTAFKPPSHSILCGRSHCISNPPPTSLIEYTSDFDTPELQTEIKLQAHLFEMAGNETGAELTTCSGCTADDVRQTYVFLIPARSTPQGGTLPEYAFLTYLRPTLPSGNGTNVTMALSDASHPDTDPTPYTEFVFNGTTLTGKLMGPPLGEVCIDEDRDVGGFFCTQVASFQEYRALTRIRYKLNTELDTMFSFAALPSLPFAGQTTGYLFPMDATWITDETALP